MTPTCTSSTNTSMKGYVDLTTKIHIFSIYYSHCMLNLYYAYYSQSNAGVMWQFAKVYYLWFWFTDALSAGITYGVGSGPIHVDQVNCSGIEQRLTDCSHSMLVSSCSHTQDVGVACQPPIYPGKYSSCDQCVSESNCICSYIIIPFGWGRGFREEWVCNLFECHAVTAPTCTSLIWF